MGDTLKFVPDIVIHALAAAAYAALAWHFWNTRWRAGSEQAPAGLAGWERAALAAALGVHGAILAQLLFLADGPRFGFAFALSSMLWLAVLIYWVESLFVNLDTILPGALGLTALCVPLTAWFPGRAPTTTSLEFRVHIALVILAYGVLTIALLHAVLMALVERLLHRVRQPAAAGALGGVLSGPLSTLPPLLTLERMLFRLIALAFVLLTLTLATGMTLSESLFGQALKFNHETVFAVVSWLVFGLLLVGRYTRGWRGRTAMRWVLTGYLLVILAGVGTRFVLEVLLGRS
jgi:ABC-type uncharacterized transport system permease subunit